MYQYFWKNQDLKGKPLKHNVIGVLSGSDPIPKMVENDVPN
jgi:hypothetical protein